VQFCVFPNDTENGRYAMKHPNELYCQLHTFVKSEKIQTVIGYGLMLLLVVLIAILSINGIGGGRKSSYVNVSGSLQ